MILHGRNLIIKADGVAIAAARSCDITIATDEIETASPSDGQWKTSVLGRKSWKVNTSHLVTSMVKQAEMAGTTVSLSVQLRDDIGMPFNGFVDNVTIQPGSFNADLQYRYWDKTHKKFVGLVVAQPVKYYALWENSEPYSNPKDYDMFHEVTDELGAFVWINGNLSSEKLTGNAHVMTWKGAAIIQNLMQGSFELKGTGPLTPASLP